MTKRVKHLYEFEPFILDATERILRRNGREVRLTLKQYEVLLILVENSGHIVEREDIMQRGWPDSFVEEAVITQNISDLRKMLREGGNNSQYIETIPKRGYRFTAPVREVIQGDGSLSPSRNLVPFPSEGFIPTYSDVGQADHKGKLIKDIDKPVAEAIEAHLRKLSEDVTLTLLRIEEGSVKLILEGTRTGFERIRELMELGQLTEIFGFDIEDLLWEPSSERVKIEPPQPVQPHLGDLSPQKDRSGPTQGAWALLTQSAFDRMLLLLGADREEASKRYVMICQKLIRMFQVRGADNPEELVDEAISRVVQKVEEGIEITTSIEHFFYGVANQVFRQYSRSHYLSESMPAFQMPEAEASKDYEKKHECLEKCLNSLPANERELILVYYSYTENKIRERKNLAAQFGITQNALRIQITKIRTKLKICIAACMEQSSTDIQKDKQE